MIVPVATGPWRIVATAIGVRLLPPRDQAGAPGLTVLGVEPPVPLPGQPLTVRFRSNLPAIISATAQPPGAAAAPALAPQVIGTEERRFTLAAATRPGPYSLTLIADGGPGRSATLTVAPAVADPNAPPPAPTGGLLGPLPEGGLLDGGLSQTLIAAPPDTGTAGERPIPPARASRSAALVSSGSRPTPPAPASSDHGGLGVVLAAGSGLAVWRFLARSNRRSFSAVSR